MEFFLCVIGMVLVIEGLPYFGFPEKMKQLMSSILDRDDASLRMAGAIMVLLGLMIILAARKGLGR